MLLFEAVYARYGNGAHTLSNVCLEIPRGQFCVLLGTSGAGKSTLLRTVNGLVMPSGGRVSIEGEQLGRRTLPRIRRRVSMIHQSFNLVPRLSVEDNILSGALAVQPFWRVMLGVSPQPLRAKAASLALRMGLDAGQFARRAANLSGGQQQRVGIARAFLLDPDIVLADEPVASLDPRTSEQTLALLREAARERAVTVLCSLHQIDLAREFADRVVGLRSGKVVYDGPPSDLDEAAVEHIYGEVQER